MSGDLEDPDEEALSGRGARRRLIAVAVSLPFLAVIGLGVWFFVDQQQRASEMALIEQISGAAFGCVASIRGDAPDAWGIERALEHMARMKRVTQGDAAAAVEKARFVQLATDAARGCDALGTLMMRAREEAPHLYFAVPTKLAQPPDHDAPERWFRHVLPERRADVVTLAGQIRAMQEAINARRATHALMPTALPIAGRGAATLAEQVTLAALPSELERVTAEAWPTPDGIVVLRRGSIPRVPCDMRYINRTSCYRDFVQTVSYTGELGPLHELERPERVSYWAGFTAAQDGTLWAVGVDPEGQGQVGRYPAGATTPTLSAFPGTVDATARIAEVIGGLAIDASDGQRWMSSGGGPFTHAPGALVRVVLAPAHEGPASGIRVDGLGTLSIFGSQQDGFTSRLSTPTGELLMRLIDANSRVRAVTALRGLRTGHVAALLLRAEDGPDAILISTDFGHTWLAEDQ